MPAPVSLVTVHHEGAGTPSDDPRGAAGGYTYWIGATRCEHLRDVWHSYATLNFNHRSLDICLSGNRMDVAVTANDIALIRAAATDARARGYVVDAPYVRSHHDSPGSSTVCPGTHARDPLTWLAIVTACHKEAPPMPPAVDPEFFPALSIVSWCQTRDGVVGVSADGAVFAIPPAAYHGGANGKAYFAGRAAARIQPSKNPQKVYEIIATSKEPYAYPE